MKLYRDVEAMRALPIFKPEMRQANREGLKSQTRRVMDPQVEDKYWDKKMNNASIWNPRRELLRFCPYGKVGDVVYMREPLVQVGAYAFYKDDNQPVVSLVTGEMLHWRWKVKTLSGMFMPGEAARFMYRYESIRVERVQEISHEDAVAEGVDMRGLCSGTGLQTYAQYQYQKLWDEINAKRGFGWDANPWVWVLEYKVVTPSAFGTSPILEERQNGGGKAGVR